jgi:hypothetical protein
MLAIIFVAPGSMDMPHTGSIIGFSDDFDFIIKVPSLNLRLLSKDKTPYKAGNLYGFIFEGDRPVDFAKRLTVFGKQGHGFAWHCSGMRLAKTQEIGILADHKS